MALMGRPPRACIAAGRKSPSDRKAEVYNTPFWQENLPEGFGTSGDCRQRQLHADVFPEKTAKKAPGITRRVRFILLAYIVRRAKSRTRKPSSVKVAK